ncbi:MAG: DNA polymerase III subunit alpha [Nitrospirota bacterium]
MPRPQFVHLHVHTQYSLLDGANRIDRLVRQAAAFKMPAIAMTDHGNLFGAIEFYLAARKAGVKPIIGCEMYLAPQSRFTKDGAGEQDDSFETKGAGQQTPYYHLIVLAADEVGYKNLMKLVSLAHLEGFYYKPRVDKELLARHSKGLLATSGCLRGEIPFLLNQGLREEALQAAGTYQDIFGKDNFFIEVQENGLEQQTRVNRDLVEISRRLTIPLVATNDCHYLERHDAKAHDVLLCLQTGKTRQDPNRMRFSTEELYVKSPEDMTSLFHELPDAVRQTLSIAERCNLVLDLETFHLPHYAVPDGVTRDAHLERLAVAGLRERLARIHHDPATAAAYEIRLRDELAMITAMGYAGYFLIVWDIINFARTHGIPVGPGRGSAAGSLAAYALQITDIDPIRYGLIFERFLNPERVSLPDIDMDFCMDRRGEVIQYVTQKYGADHVAQIITFGTMAAKAAIRDVGRVLDIPYAEVDKVAKLVPNTLNISLEDALAEEPRLKELADTDPKIGELIALAKSLEGLARHASTHAAGVVISKEPLTEHVPLYRGVNGEVVTQFAMTEIEKIGLVKFDFLGLRTLTVIDHAVKMINARRPEQPPLGSADIPLDDAKTYELLGTGQTTGIFQLESGGMRDLLVKMRPERFEDLIAILALYRPGPIGSGMLDDFIKRKRGQTKIQYEIPELEDLLRETYGVIVYQEQVMKIANHLAGFSLGDADLLRRAMGKKLPEEMDKQKALFIAGAAKNGVDAKKAEKIFDLMAYFAGYGFNKSHSAAYALITYQTAYLKTHHPLEFMAALLTSEMGNEDKIVQYIGECRTMGIAILPPDVNESNEGFTIAGSAIRFGLVAIKNVGASAIESVLEARRTHGRFRSLAHFCREVDLRKVNRRVIESLIKCGSFASTGARRAQLMQVLDRTMEAAAASQDERRSGQVALFGSSTEHEPADTAPEPVMPEWDDTTLARCEKETLGFYITSHPLAPYAPDAERLGVTPTDRLADAGDGDDVRVWGVLASQKVTTTKKGDRMAYVRVEDLGGSVETIVFPDLYAASAELLASDQPLLIDGTLDKGDKGIKLKATRIVSLESARQRAGGYLEIVVDDGVSRDGLRQLKDTLERHRGSYPVWLRVLLRQSRRESTIVADDGLRVNPTRALIDEIESGLGKGTAAVRSDPYRAPSRPVSSARTRRTMPSRATP